MFIELFIEYNPIKLREGNCGDPRAFKRFPPAGVAMARNREREAAVVVPPFK